MLRALILDIMQLIQSTSIGAALLLATAVFAADKKPEAPSAKPGKQAPASTETTVNLTVTGMT
jgi:hypothetical protein